LLRYPVAYSIVVLPLSVVRWTTFTKQKCGEKSIVPVAATFAAAGLFGCFGFVNVILLLTTRRALLLFDDPKNPRQLRLRRRPGLALEDGDGDAFVDLTSSPSLSSKDGILGSKRSREGSKGATVGAEISLKIKEVQLESDEVIETRQITSSPFHSNGPTRRRERAVSLDSIRDVLGIVTNIPGQRKENCDSSAVLSPRTVSSHSRIGPGTGVPLLARLHSKTISGGSGTAQGQGHGSDDAYSGEGIARRLAEVTPPSTTTNSGSRGAQRWDL